MIKITKDKKEEKIFEKITDFIIWAQTLDDYYRPTLFFQAVTIASLHGYHVFVVPIGS